MTITEKRARLANLRALIKRAEDEATLLADELSRVTPIGIKRSRYVVPPCGTETAYQRHRYYGEERDDACLRAHALYVKAGHVRKAQREREAS